ncbi:class IV adenylate cyclase [Acrocarpospora catenulata]|uniref:class IV adenylate cyclase n=1 Tax=Acrocarpospora catenulata TaxID=2836182 RepID=UPI001BDB3E62|nr:class IV adenylate cyclase [Acrocarpospora catenulata]
MIEGELKARVHQPSGVREKLRERATEQRTTYHDVYYDQHDGTFTASGRELRVRTITSKDATRTLLTFKEPAVDEASGSKPEHETEIGDAATMDRILRALRYERLISFEKHCENFAYHVEGYQVLASLVTVPELDGTFIEIETLVSSEGLSVALDVLRAELARLGIADDDLTTELYTDAVKQRRDSHSV